MNLSQWAVRHGITGDAMAELVALLAQAPAPDVHPASDASEAAVQAAIRLEAPHKRAPLWRNNVGVAEGRDGVPIRFGLANDSARLNRSVKSSDLIGVVPMLIQHHHLGRTIGAFGAFECKRGNWTYSGTKREQAQKKYMDIVSGAGGCSGFVRSVAQFNQIVEAYRYGTNTLAL